MKRKLIGMILLMAMYAILSTGCAPRRGGPPAPPKPPVPPAAPAR